MLKIKYGNKMNILRKFNFLDKMENIILLWLILYFD